MEKERDSIKPEDLLKQAREIIDKAKKQAFESIKEAKVQAKEIRKMAEDEAKRIHQEYRKVRRHERHKRHDKFLHLRIDDELESKIQEEADRKRVPSSILVRDILYSAFDLVESVAGNVGSLIEDVVEDAKGVARHFQKQECDEGDEAKDVVAWQEVKLNKSSDCPFCGLKMNAGDTAYMGVKADGSAPVFVPKGCAYPEPDNPNPVCLHEDADKESDEDEQDEEKEIQKEAAGDARSDS